MPQIEEGLGHLGWNVNDLDEIYVGVGPGSYTGLRIGVVVAKMFGWNSQIPVFQVSSLALMASSVDQEGLILPEIDARRGNSFLGLYDLCEGILTIQETESLSHLEDYKKGLKKPFTQVSEGKPNMQRIIESKMFHPVEDIHSLHPNYLRQTEAERNLKNS
jgi:tRNA threonylcarbamoyladenosine biosynthesis protein TsaB